MIYCKYGCPPSFNEKPQNKIENITISVSVAELFDKVSILEIKLEKIVDSNKLKEVENELNILKDTFNKYNNTKESQLLFNKIKEVNKQLWEIEDKIRIKHRLSQFDEKFIELAKGVYFTNDMRFEVKNEINLLFGSNIKEVKSYEEYKKKSE